MATYHPIIIGLTALFFFATLHSANCLHCWDCNSAYDPRCGDPFDNHSIAMVDCSQMSYPHLSVKEATLCRKTTQSVNGNVRVVRSCGWLNSSNEDDGKSCFKRSGSQDVFLTHCTCSGDGCNGSPSLMPTALLTIPVLLTVVFYPFSVLFSGFC
ncbi:uncharacterized protein LOC124201155 [Daphnia pulex]|uniref:Uncharacterized protein n=1 Tax=Daphnia pulex TaxID=6669 RepID=E9HBK9_DAPPU|nr:uncharacterized protein LOC124201155 [Daphnia pulex]EFX70861.1 hypothetical protein DAPPUDRAFT_217048 [Daphnia pulex]|eukprot:EFX70861.1 hypothetical protein DAPPUDRAFT_217048 [Daphnia pulex]